MRAASPRGTVEMTVSWLMLVCCWSVLPFRSYPVYVSSPRRLTLFIQKYVRFLPTPGIISFLVSFSVAAAEASVREPGVQVGGIWEVGISAVT
jgi:branched-subunit amino acid transport protein